jgi:hypothetical protein
MLLRSITSVLLFAIGTAAHADTFQFNYSGVTESYQGVLRQDTFSLQVTTSALTNGTVDSLGQITYTLPATVNGVVVPNVLLSKAHTWSPGIDVDTFYIDSFAGGQWNYYYFISYGLFLTGALDQPVITPGSYSLVGENYRLGAPVAGELTVVDLSTPAPTPEPASLALVSTSLLGFAFLWRKRFDGVAHS